MKYTLRQMAAVAAMLLATTGQAAIISVVAGDPLVFSGPLGDSQPPELIISPYSAGALEFSNGTGVVGGMPSDSVAGVVGVLNQTHMVLLPLDGMQLSVTEVPGGINGEAAYGIVKLGANVASVTLDNETGQIQTVGSQGGVWGVSNRIGGVLTGGIVAASNLRFDLVNKAVIADVTGTPLVLDEARQLYVEGPTTSQPNLALWTIADITGPTSIRPEALVAAGSGDFNKMLADGYTLDSVVPTDDPNTTLFSVSAKNVLSGLKVTPEGMAYFASSLGIKEGSSLYATLADVNNQPDGWGSITSTLSFSTVPEPSTYALMGLGLVGITLVARRRPS
jgi:hypothetical protein